MCREYEIEIGPWSGMIRQLLSSRYSTRVVLEFLAMIREGERPEVLDQKQ